MATQDELDIIRGASVPEGQAKSPQPQPATNQQWYSSLDEANSNMPKDQQNYVLHGQGWPDTKYAWIHKSVQTESKGFPAPGADLGTVAKSLDAGDRAMQYMMDSGTRTISDQAKTIASSLGNGLWRGLANGLGTPVDAVAAGMNYLMMHPSTIIPGVGGTDRGENLDTMLGAKYPPIQNPVGGSQNIKNLLGRIGINTTSDESTAEGYISSKIGEFAGGGLPLTGIPLKIAGAMSPMAAARSNVPNVALAATNPMKLAAEDTAINAFAGLGAGSGGEIGGHATPDEEATNEIIGSAVFNPRLPIAAIAKKTATAPFKMAKSAVKTVMGGKTTAESEAQVGKTLANAALSQPTVLDSIANAPKTMVPGQQLTTGALSGDQVLMALKANTIMKSAEAQGHYIDQLVATQDAMRNAAEYMANPGAAVNAALRARLMAAIESAQVHIASLGGLQNPVLASKNLEKASAVIRAELEQAEKDASMSEGLVWKSVDRSLPRSFEGVQNLFKQLEAEAEANPLKDPKAFPRELEPLLFDPRGPSLENIVSHDEMGNLTITQAPPKGGLSSLDTLGNGQDVRSRILQMVREENAKDAPNNARVAALTKIQMQLLEDIGGAGPATDPALKNALAFSRAKNEIFNAKPVATAMSTSKSGADKVGAAQVLENFLASGAKGADALDGLLGASQYRYGGNGPDSMVMAFKDALRQKFVSEVAANGYIAPSDYTRFKEKYANILARFPDIQQQFESAANAESGVNRILNLGKEGPYATRNARADLFLDAPLGTTMNYVLGAQNQGMAMRQVLQQLKRDATGDAVKGFSQSLVEKMFADNETTRGTAIMGGGIRLNGNGIVKWIDNNSDVIKALDRANPGFAGRMEQIQNTAAAFEREFVNPKTPVSDVTTKLGFLGNLLSTYIGAKAGSAVSSIGGGGVGAPFVMAGRMAEAARALAARMLPQDQLKIASAALADPMYYKTITQPFTDDPLQQQLAMHSLITFFATVINPNMYGQGAPQQ